MEKVDQLLGIFLLNNYTGKHHGISGIYGWRLENFKIGTYFGRSLFHSCKSNHVSLVRLSLGLVIPYKIFNEENPWAPPILSILIPLFYLK
jgi:hypothetical protein